MLARIGILKGLRSNNGPIVRSSVSPEVNGTDSFRGKAAGESNPLRLTDLNPTTRQAPQYAKRATRRSSAGQRCELRRERVAMLRKIALLTISAFGLTNIASGENKKTELGSAGTKALAYFEGIAERSLDVLVHEQRAALGRGEQGELGGKHGVGSQLEGFSGSSMSFVRGNAGAPMAIQRRIFSISAPLGRCLILLGGITRTASIVTKSS